MTTQAHMTLAEFKRQLSAGQHVERTVLIDGRIISTQKRVISSVTSDAFCTSDEEFTSLSEMRFGSAKEWQFDDYIGDFGALWTDPNDFAYQVHIVLGR